MVKSKKTKEKKLGNIGKRVLAAFVMLPVVIGTLWFGYPYIDILALLVGILLAWEWVNMIPSRKPLIYFGAYILSLSVAIFVYTTYAISLTILLTTLFVYLKSRKEKECFLITLGVPYISIGVGSMMWIYHDIFTYAPYNFYMTLWFLFVVWAMDVGAYIIGSNLKGPKLAPKISPNKTWSGLIGGIIFAICISQLYLMLLAHLRWIGTDTRSQILFMILSGLVAALSQVGDLIESAIKRHVDIKDSSNLIPGHGGVFDRIDGLIFVAPFVYWLFGYGLGYFF